VLLDAYLLHKAIYEVGYELCLSAGFSACLLIPCKISDVIRRYIDVTDKLREAAASSMPLKNFGLQRLC
jgi:predicted trehalose synthase